MNLRIFIYLCIFALFFPILAIAQGALEPTNMGEVVNLLPEVQRALEGKNWAYLLVLVLMIVTYAIKRFCLSKDGSQDRRLPIITSTMGAFLGAAGSVALSGDILSGAIGGLMAGNAANGAYDAFIKPVKK